MSYQLIVLGTAKAKRQTEVEKAFADGLVALGLSPSGDSVVLDSARMAQVDWDEAVVGIWLSENQYHDPTDLQCLDRLISENAPIFPVYEPGSGFLQVIPKQLHPINGQEWDAPRVASDILRAFGLTRAQRQAFISYKRSDSRGTALQLFDALSQRGYRTFLDTASIDRGVDFQRALWNRMADVDLLVFLDTKGALDSTWVIQELARAHDIGLGILQLVWPDTKRTPGTELSDMIQLGSPDFEGANHGSTGTLTQPCLEKVLADAERSRIRSLRFRRLRVVGDLVDQAKALKLDAVVPPAGPIVLFKDGSEVAQAIAFVGTPDAPGIQEKESQHSGDNWTTVRIVYNGLGVDQDWSNHLDWLNKRKGLQVVQVARISDWLKKVISLKDSR